MDHHLFSGLGLGRPSIRKSVPERFKVNGSPVVAPAACMPGSRLQPLECLLKERGPVTILRIPRRRERKVHRKCVVGIEAKIHLLKPEEASYHQARPDQQHQRERDFGGDERASYALGGAAAG